MKIIFFSARDGGQSSFSGGSGAFRTGNDGNSRGKFQTSIDRNWSNFLFQDVIIVIKLVI
jgi:hypothetical protein